ncbi:MAG TPA: Clp protease N-terminal domain-containing protein [Oligoflexia bacterium]|nr:Clp protease N-terminal domain-containing protein [Oligoflexia bacterium]HMP47504.1 Clp protease N-terminal domain-containing protein [Oligoflexia bacterium]
MYKRFSEEAKEVMQFANQEAQKLNHDYIGTEHILFGLLNSFQGIAWNIFLQLDVHPRKIRLELQKLVQAGEERASIGKLPNTPRVKKVLDIALQEVKACCKDMVGPVHLLLALASEQTFFQQRYYRVDLFGPFLYAS